MSAAGRPIVAAVIRELIQLGVVTVDDAVTQGIVAIDASMSHLSFRLQIGDSGRLFVKRSDPVGSQGRDLATEAAVYRLALRDERLASVVPPCRFVAVDDSLVVLDDVSAAPLTFECLAAERVAVGSAGPAGALDGYARAVARTHQVRPPPMGQPPWFLEALEPRWGSYEWLPPACRDLLSRLASSPGRRQAFRSAASRWQPSRLIHGDLRWSNVLAILETRPVRVWLVDWELACLGDPAWDIGSVIGDLVAGSVTASYLGATHDPLAAAAIFLRAYHLEAPHDAAELAALSVRSVAFAGMRLAQTLVEYGHSGADHLAAAEPLLLPWIDALMTDDATIGRRLAADAVPAGSDA
jgi:Phosphotransferase enzyme family